VKVHTDAGITGIGEMHPASNTSGTRLTPAASVKFLEEYLIGKDPTHIERHWQHTFRRSLFRGGSDAMAAIAAVDMALWDIKGKLTRLPVYKLLGGPTREKVRLFGTPVSRGALTPEGVAESARELVEQGFTAVRLYPLGDPETFAGMGFHSIVRTAERYVAATRKAVGDEVDVAIDVICRLTPAEAIAVGRALEPYGLYFFEDPIEPDNIDAMAYVAENLPMSVATGERLCTIYQFRELLNKNAAAFVRPDLGLAGGITNCRKIATLAEASYVGVIPHCPLSWVVTAASVQLCAAIHNAPILEFHYQGNELNPPVNDLFREPLQVENGYLIVPNTPGLGIELNEEVFKHYPPVSGMRPPIIGRDGALRDY
jgi:galactonate dehydratase